MRFGVGLAQLSRHHASQQRRSFSLLASTLDVTRYSSINNNNNSCKDKPTAFSTKLTLQADENGNPILSFQYRAKSTKASSRKMSVASVSTDAATKGKEEKEVDEGNGWLYDLGLKSLVPEWKKMLSKETMFTDISSGLTVGCVAIPLSLAIALASGVPAEVGLVTAAVSGVAGGLMGGTTLAVTGPAAAISLLVIGAVQQHGLEALPVITLACGGLQVMSGVTRMGMAAKVVPVSVIAGFTYGVGTLILTGQIPKALGITGVPHGLNPVELMGYVGSHLGAVDPAATAVALGTAAALYTLPKIHSKIPAALLAVGGATAATHTFGLDVALIGQIPSGLSAFAMAAPVLPPMDALPSLAATTLLIYSMTSVESLLSCAALEKMRKTGYHHDPDQELIGQGVANVASGLFMGMPVTSVIARSSLNVRCQAQTRFASLVQAGFVFSGVAFGASSIALIPIPALSGVLIMTGVGMLNPHEIKHCWAVQKSDAAPFLATMAGMLSMGLAEGIGIGCVTAFALNYGNFSQNAATLTKMQALPLPLFLPESSSTTETAQAWKVEGPINFISMFEIDHLVKRIKRAPAQQKVLLDMEGVTSLEFTGVEELVLRLHQVERPIHMIHCSQELLDALDLCDPKREIERTLSSNLQKES